MKKILSALAIATLLAASINREGLWTDEAFSAFLASHRTFASCWSSLLHGDSSDLQMALYYLFLHGWTSLFGQSEVAFRTANIPFILLYATVLVWASHRLFRSKWVWSIATLAPLAVVFASDTRPYFDVIAISLTCVTSLLVYLDSPTLRERKVLPWLVLLSLLLGATFHMLMLLVAPPLLLIVAIFYWTDRKLLRWHDWKWPLLSLSPVFLLLMAYFAWTLGRGVAYDYAHPDLMSMGSVLFRFVGLSGFSPNRRYELPFRPFLPAMAISTAVFVAGLALLFVSSYRSAASRRFFALFYALGLAIIEVAVLSFAVHQQIEFRHLSSLLPLLILLIMDGCASRISKLTLTAAAAIGVTWLISDVILLGSPNYRREDFKSSVEKCLQLQKSAKENGRNAVIAVAADPLAAAYYGLAMQGPAPCFPLQNSCQQDLALVDWPKKSDAQYALFWSEPQIKDWLALQKAAHSKVILLISRSRHPTITSSAWWPVIQHQPSVHLYPEYGFFVYETQ